MNKLPQPKNVEAPNLADEWKRWREEVELYIDLTMDSEDENVSLSGRHTRERSVRNIDI